MDADDDAAVAMEEGKAMEIEDGDGDTVMGNTTPPPINVNIGTGDLDHLPISDPNRDAVDLSNIPQNVIEEIQQRLTSIPEGFDHVAGNRAYLEELAREQKVMFRTTKYPGFENWGKLFHILMYMVKFECLLINIFERGAFSTGLGWGRLRNILDRREPFKGMLEELDKKYIIHNGFIVANESGSHDFHQDSFASGGQLIV